MHMEQVNNETYKNASEPGTKLTEYNPRWTSTEREIDMMKGVASVTVSSEEAWASADVMSGRQGNPNGKYTEC